MMAQIEWYEEILALEPGSKVFFPFAKRLESEGQRGKALNVLRQGLAQHPEYLEARVLLAHLLQSSGDTETASAEAGAVFARLCDYPDFWVAAGMAQLAQSTKHPTAEDVALLLNMLAENARRPGQSFASLMRGACGPVKAQDGDKPAVASIENAQDAEKTSAIAVEKAAEMAAVEAAVEAAKLVEEAALNAAVEIVEKVTAELTVCSATELPDTQDQQSEPIAPANMPSETIDGIPVTAAEVMIHAVEQELFDRPVDEVQHAELLVNGGGEKLTEEEFSLLIAEKIIQASDRKEGHPDELLDLPEDMNADFEQDDADNEAVSEVEMPVQDADETAVGDAEIFDSTESLASTDINDLATEELELTEMADPAEAPLAAELAEDPLVSIDCENMDALLASLPEPLETSHEDTAIDPLAEEVEVEPEVEEPEAEGSEAEEPEAEGPEVEEPEAEGSVAEGPQVEEPEVEEPEDTEAASAPDFEVELTEVVEELAQELNNGPTRDLSQKAADDLPEEASDDVGAELSEELDDEPVRTRSMAEVLAEQGDMEGALAIYNELLLSAQPEEAQMLKQRMAALSGEQSLENSEQALNAAPKTEKTEKNARADNAGLRKMLENLAGRLEKRARN